MNDVTAGIPLDWRAQLDPIVDWTRFEATQSLVQADREANPGRVYPLAPEVFQALEMTSFSSVRAVILGQDPYPPRGQAHGLAFSLWVVHLHDASDLRDAVARSQQQTYAV